MPWGRLHGSSRRRRIGTPGLAGPAEAIGPRGGKPHRGRLGKSVVYRGADRRVRRNPGRMDLNCRCTPTPTPSVRTRDAWFVHPHGPWRNPWFVHRASAGTLAGCTTGVVDRVRPDSTGDRGLNTNGCFSRGPGMGPHRDGPGRIVLEERTPLAGVAGGHPPLTVLGTKQGPSDP